MNHLVPPPAETEPFRWEVEPSGGLIQGTVYIDGCQLDGPSDLLRRCGCSFVAIDDDGDVAAVAYVVPPPWIDTIGGAEAWAVHKASSWARPGSQFRVDCQPCVDVVVVGPAVVGLGKRFESS